MHICKGYTRGGEKCKRKIRESNQSEYCTYHHIPSGEDCSICFEPMQKQVMQLYCTHQFHVKCIRKWFKTHATCPNCRTVVRKRKKKEEPLPILSNVNYMARHTQTRRILAYLSVQPNPLPEVFTNALDFLTALDVISQDQVSNGQVYFERIDSVAFSPAPTPTPPPAPTPANTPSR